MTGTKLILVRDFDAEVFHKKVMEMEAQGYVANRDTYRIAPEMDPETGNIIHLYTIEMTKAES